MWIAQITDTHIKLPGKLAYGKVDTATLLEKAVARLNTQLPRPDLVVITGDLVDFGQPLEYAHLRRLLAPLTIPFLLVPGNHDERGALRAAFPEHSYLPESGFLHYAIEERYPLRMVGLDTVVPGEGRGELCEQRLRWISQTLAAEPTKPTLILMHHPPFRCGIEHMERVGLTGIEPFAEILSRHPQVQAVLCGHLHRNIFTTVGGLPVVCSVGPAHQVALELEGGEPGSFCMEPPGFMLHRWQDGQFLSHAVVVGDFAGPFPFYDANGHLLD
jgi:3',5'-cyclic-AMP phosphodiesterase